MNTHSPGTRRKAPTLTLATALALALTVAACSSSGSSSSSTKPANAGSSAAPGAAANTDVAAAQQIVQDAKKGPATIGPTAPLPSAPPKGKTIIYIGSEVVQSPYMEKGVKAAAAAIGWTEKTLSYDLANPVTFDSAMQQALGLNPVAVTFEGVPEVVWKPLVGAFQSAGVAIIPNLVGPVTFNSAVVANLSGDAYVAQNAKYMANWLTADSNGKGKALLIGLPAIPIEKVILDAFAATIKTTCPGCSTKLLNGTLADGENGTLTGQIVSALQRDPSIKYVISGDLALQSALPSKLKSAGLADIRIAGSSGDVQQQSQLKTGEIKAITTLGQISTGWQAVDVAVRHVMKLPIDRADGGAPIVLLTKDNPGTPSISNDYPSNYADIFSKLWQIS